MAYARQPQYGNPRRPHYQERQPLYGSPRETYTAKYDPRDQAAHIKGSLRHGPPQEYQNANYLLGENGETYGYNEGWPTQDNSYDGGNGRYGGRGQNRGRRWSPAQRAHGRPIEAGRHSHNDPRSRGPPHLRSAPPDQGDYHQQDQYYQSNQYHEPQGYGHHYQPERMLHNGQQQHDNREYEYDGYSLETSNNWPTQHHNRSHDDDLAYQHPNYNPGYPQQDQGGSYDRKVSPGSLRNDRPPRHPEAPASRFNPKQHDSTRPHNPQHPNPCKSAKA